MSISKSQAAALAEGLLDDLGTDKGELQPRETFTELILLAGELVEQAQSNLNTSNSNASGKLSSSISISEPTKTGNVVECDIEMNFYGEFVNSGVKGTKGGSGKYAFKYDLPSRKMVSAIREWQRGGRARSTNVNKNKSIRKNEVKNKTISEIDSAYAIARSIVQRGIKATGFMDKAIDGTANLMQERLGAAFKVDIINSIQDGDNNTGISR